MSQDFEKTVHFLVHQALASFKCIVYAISVMNN